MSDNWVLPSRFRDGRFQSSRGESIGSRRRGGIEAMRSKILTGDEGWREIWAASRRERGILKMNKADEGAGRIDVPTKRAFAQVKANHMTILMVIAALHPYHEQQSKPASDAMLLGFQDWNV
ncbi:uncharacterized protein LOC111900505 [Lactuca sativa]|uniref:Uncharacterized protein n=1 Tax=Lactuca sativa TaxID=4236 RepID=A0A9R1UYJ0_LACSA|nr:uncharacterized protein LOC111900505 [Lactuca sativa]KAJ0196171.1 hypothetical protein LSAT_V11C700380840 [Lactuca sativa]